MLRVIPEQKERVILIIGIELQKDNILQIFKAKKTILGILVIVVNLMMNIGNEWEELLLSKMGTSIEMSLSGKLCPETSCSGAQMVDENTRSEAFAEYNSKPGYRKDVLSIFLLQRLQQGCK